MMAFTFKLLGQFGWTAPMRAAHCGHSGVVKVLQAAEPDLPQMFHVRND